MFVMDESDAADQADGVKSVGSLVAECWRAAGSGNQVKAWEIPDGKTNCNACALLCFSSGTTGLPKAVSLHRGGLELLDM